MGIRLTLLSWWTPNYIIRREIDRIFKLTANALTSLLESHAPVTFAKIAKETALPPGNVSQKRAAMARTHALLVEALSVAVGREQAVDLGRKALFEVGKSLGKETRGKLGIGDSPNDLIRVARVMYKVLGIEFNVEWHGKTNATIVVDRCALAKEYSELTCLVLSATDEGVISGLEPNASMLFKEHMTSGCGKCSALIELNQKEK
jgi:hypothetical protein